MKPAPARGTPRVTSQAIVASDCLVTGRQCRATRLTQNSGSIEFPAGRERERERERERIARRDRGNARECRRDGRAQVIESAAVRKVRLPTRAIIRHRGSSSGLEKKTHTWHAGYSLITVIQPRGGRPRRLRKSSYKVKSGRGYPAPRSLS